MSLQVVAPRIRGFISLTAHPDGCAANVRAQIGVARRFAAGGRAGGSAPPLGPALVVGSSTGYGLASLLSACFGYGAPAVGVCLERPSEEDRAGSAGWYNLAEAHRLAAAEGRTLRTINADAFSAGAKEQAAAALRACGAPAALLVYSLAAPLRRDAASGAVWRSTLKPIGRDWTGKSIDLRRDEVTEAVIEAASGDEIAATVRVMGGEDWAEWVRSLRAEGLLADDCRTVAYSYVGPESTHAIYRAGTIGRAKEHLEATARELHAELAPGGGGAWVSINKGVVTQASAAIPGVALYMSVLFAVMKERGTHEGPIEQIARLMRDHLGPGAAPATDAEGRIRLDDLEMAPEAQAEAARRLAAIDTASLHALSDYAGWGRYFRRLFGFGVEGVDYGAPTEIHRPLAQAPAA